MIAKCPCEHCGKNIEFATEEFLSGSSVICPHCGKETILYVSRQAKPVAKTATPVSSPSQKFTTPGAAYQKKSSTNYLPWIIVAVLGMACIFFAVNFFRERAQRILLENKLAVVEEKLNVRKADTTDANRAAVAAEMNQRVTEAKQDVRDAVAGIYEFEPPNQGKTEVFDFRSDGSVVSWFYYNNRNQTLGKKTLTWTSSKNSISIAGATLADGNMSFRPEGDDLIDEKGNRWIRIH